MNNAIIVGLSMFFSLMGSTAQAEDFGTAKEAESMVKKAIAAIKSDGKDKSYAAFTGKKQEFLLKDIYVVVYGLDGKVLAHGQNNKMVGRDMIDLKDADGKEFVKERVDLAKSKGQFWQEYKFTDPISKKILPKQMYCERLDDTAVCAGVYKH